MTEKTFAKLMLGLIGTDIIGLVSNEIHHEVTMTPEEKELRAKARAEEAARMMALEEERIEKEKIARAEAKVKLKEKMVAKLMGDMGMTREQVLGLGEDNIRRLYDRMTDFDGVENRSKYTYSYTLDKIFKETDFDSARERMASLLETCHDPEYYHAVCSAIENCDFDSARERVIKQINAQFHK